MGRGGVYNAIGVALASTGVGVPVMIRVRTAEGKMIGRITFANHLEATKFEIEWLTDTYQSRRPSRTRHKGEVPMKPALTFTLAKVKK